MRFQSLELIKYGKFSDIKIELPKAQHDFHMVIGPNEAGKSTIRSAILDVLFSIPAKSQLCFMHPLRDLQLGAVVDNGSTALEFRRTRQPKHTLRAPSGEPLDDSALAPFIGNTAAKFFDQMFGLDHYRLVEGGNDILNPEHDLGQILFESAAGVANLGKVRDALLAEAERLWAPRKASDRAFYIALDKLDKANAALKEATVRTRVWADANAKVEALEAEIERARARHRDVEVRRNGLERIRRVAPFLQSLRDNQRQLLELGDVVELPMDAAAVLSAAERDKATAEKIAELRTEEVTIATESLSGIDVDEALLGCQADILALDALRIRFSEYEVQLDRRQREVEGLWNDVREGCKQLGWNADTEHAVAAQLPAHLIRKELGKLTCEYSGVTVAHRAAVQAVKAKQSELEIVSGQLSELQISEVAPALRVALATARSLGDSDATVRKEQLAIAKSKSGLDEAIVALGQWDKSTDDLAAILPPSHEIITRAIQDRQSLVADLKSSASLVEQQKVKVTETELAIDQFREFHQPFTMEDVVSARKERDESWKAIRSGAIALAQGAGPFELTITKADNVVDSRFDKLDEANQLQSLSQQLVREKLSLSQLEEQCSRLSLELGSFDENWAAQCASLGARGISLANLNDWLSKRDRVLAAASVYQNAGNTLATESRDIANSRTLLADAIRDAGHQVLETDKLPALCVQAESLIQSIDGAKVRQRTLTEQLQSIRVQLDALKQAATDANVELTRWNDSWSQAVVKAALPIDSDIVAVETALELFARIDDRFEEMHKIRIKNIDSMNADLKQFSDEARRLAETVAPELRDFSAPEIAQSLATRLTQAQGANAEVQRLNNAISNSETQLKAAQESIRTSLARLSPLMARAAVETFDDLQAAISKSDEQRRLHVEIAKDRAALIGSGDGLSQEQIEAEVDSTDVTQLVAALAEANDELSELMPRLSTLSSDFTNARRALTEIGGSDSAATAEAMRQEAISQMADSTDRYIRVFTASRLLRWSIDRYREEKQGPMLARASGIFSKLTQGSFQKLTVDYEREPLVLEGQRPSGELVGISGMSDGTRDQLYLALRLAALELHLEKAVPLPFIADDLFVNYDDARSKAGLEALFDLSQKTQVIFLSHHSHLTQMVREVFGSEVNVVTLQ